MRRKGNPSALLVGMQTSTESNPKKGNLKWNVEAESPDSQLAMRNGPGNP